MINKKVKEILKFFGFKEAEDNSGALDKSLSDGGFLTVYESEDNLVLMISDWKETMDKKIKFLSLKFKLESIEGYSH